uniref:Uncharacterized protein n=1 Tax=Arundo donax TaxID=35708 RepID=A0A0A8YZ67_ARUDO
MARSPPGVPACQPKSPALHPHSALPCSKIRRQSIQIPNSRRLLFFPIAGRLASLLAERSRCNKIHPNRSPRKTSPIGPQGSKHGSTGIEEAARHRCSNGCCF